MEKKSIYRVVFHNQGNVYELYARKVVQSSMYAFLEVEDIVFGERSAVLVDPVDERLKEEFSGVRRTYIPLQAIVRIDEVEKAGTNRILNENTSHASKVAAFPYPSPTRPKE
ncbi:DUF1820 family protein [Acidihalobacter prosperus]